MSCSRSQPPAPFAAGARVELVSMGSDPNPIRPGELGTVRGCSWLPAPFREWQVQVSWDCGRSLSLIVPPDVAKEVL